MTCVGRHVRKILSWYGPQICREKQRVEGPPDRCPNLRGFYWAEEKIRHLYLGQGDAEVYCRKILLGFVLSHSYYHIV